MEILPLVFAMVIAGVAGGLLAGLLGVGGGIVIVPVLELTFATLGIESVHRMHMAVGTSLATIIPTSVASARAHHQKRSIDFNVVRRWAAWIAAGAVLGVVIAAYVKGDVLAIVFAVVALAAAVNMMLPLEGKKLRDDIPQGPGGTPVPLGIGLVSTLMGIGGGTMTVPALTLFGKSVHVAVGTSALFGLIIAVPAAAGYVVSGWNADNLPVGNLGYVSLIGFALISPLTVVFAPVGARIAHGLSRRALSIAFGIFLLIAALRMAWTAVA